VKAPATDPALECYFYAKLPDQTEYVVINNSVIQNDVAFKPGVELGLAPVGPSLKISGIEIEKKWEESVEKRISLGGQPLNNQQCISW